MGEKSSKGKARERNEQGSVGVGSRTRIEERVDGENKCWDEE